MFRNKKKKQAITNVIFVDLPEVEVENKGSIWMKHIITFSAVIQARKLLSK